MQEVLGLQMTAGSANTFKLYAAGSLLLIVALAGVCGWLLTRGWVGARSARGARRHERGRSCGGVSGNHADGPGEVRRWIRSSRRSTADRPCCS